MENKSNPDAMNAHTHTHNRRRSRLSAKQCGGAQAGVANNHAAQKTKMKQPVRVGQQPGPRQCGETAARPTSKTQHGGVARWRWRSAGEAAAQCGKTAARPGG